MKDLDGYLLVEVAFCLGYNKVNNKYMEDDKKIIGGYLSSALDLEDQMGLVVYGTFLKRESWPDDLNEDVFEEIKKLLTIIITETEGHGKEFLRLKEKVKNI